MRNPSRPKFLASALTLLITAGLYLAVPGQPEAAASSCSATNSGNVCWENESCVNMLFYKQCTTTHKYLPAGGSGASGGDSSLESFQGSGGCVWGQDYIGWEPRRCD